MSDRGLFLMAVVIYGLTAAYALLLWRRGFRQDDRLSYLLLLAGFGLHTVAMVKRGFTLAHCPVNNLYEATIFVLWTIVAANLVLGLSPRFRFLGAFASPVLLLVGMFALMPALDVLEPQEEAAKFWASLHASLILLAYGAFGLSAVAGAMYLTQERDLKLHRFRAFLSLLPPIQRLERVIGRMLVAGFALLTLGLVMGAGGLKRTKGIYLSTDPKIVWSGFVWLMYLALLIWRWRVARGGRRLAWSVVGGFSFVLLTFWSFNLLSKIHHP